VLVTNKDTLLKEKFVENLREPTLCRDIKRWASDNSAATFQDIHLEVRQYMEDPTPRWTAVAREATREGDELLCDEVRGQSSHQSPHGPHLGTGNYGGRGAKAGESCDGSH